MSVCHSNTHKLDRSNAQGGEGRNNRRAGRARFHECVDLLAEGDPQAPISALVHERAPLLPASRTRRGHRLTVEKDLTAGGLPRGPTASNNSENV